MSERKKVLMLATTAAMIEQFNKHNIMILCDMGYEVHVVGNFDEGNPISNEKLDEFKKWLESLECKWFNNVSTRKPYDVVNNYKAYRRVLKLINEYKYTFVHCHNPIGAVIGRLAGHKTSTKVIYTAHGFHFFRGSSLINWLLYYPVEKVLSRYTNVIVTINSEDYGISINRLHPNRTVYIPGVGIDTSEFETQDMDNNIKEELGIPCDAKVLLSVGELNNNKNHERVIRALTLLNERIYYIIVGRGKLEERLNNIAKRIGKSEYVRILGFKPDIKRYYSGSDYFILPSKREGLNVSLMEAMASGMPCLASNVRGNTDLIDEGKGGYLFNPYSIKDIAVVIDRIMHTNERFGQYNLEKIKAFDTKCVNDRMKELYKEIDE